MRLGCKDSNRRWRNALWIIYQRIFTQFSKMGWRKREPVPLPPEEPRLLRKIVEAHLQHARLSDLASMLNTSEDRLAELLCADKQKLRLAQSP